MKVLKNIAIEILKILESKGHQAYLAGGCVRDRLLNRVTNDYDIATSASVTEVSSIFTQKDWKVIPTGIDHGTVTVVYKSSHPYEVTTFRKDLKTDGRRAEVSHDQVSLEEDASRRDFTINAMYEDSEGKVIDFFDGTNDINRKVLRFVGDPSERIQEDYLRILRLFRFSSQLGFEITDAALSSTKELVSGLELISLERVTKEWQLLLNGHSYINALDLMRQSSVLTTLFPAIKWQEVKFSELKTLKASKHLELAIMAAIQIQTKASDADGFIKKLCLPKKDIGLLNYAMCLDKIDSEVLSQPSDAMIILDQCEHYGSEESIFGFFLPLWTYCARHPQLKTKLKYLAEIEEKWGHLRRRKLPISGIDLSEQLGIKEGPDVGRCLLELKIGFRNQIWSTREEGLHQAKIIAKKYGIT